MQKLEELFNNLQKSAFRSNFRLNSKELKYLEEKGFPVIMKHGREFILERIAPSIPSNDGKQTPWGNHPVFVAQHATATCCRGCLEKWHKISKGKKLTESEINYILTVIEHWLKNYGVSQ